MSHRSIASLLLGALMLGAGAAAHADSWHDRGNHWGHDWHGDRGNGSHYYRSWGDGRGGSDWRPRSDYHHDWRAGRDWRGHGWGRRDWDDDWDRRWDDRRYHHYRPYGRDYYYDDSYYGGGYYGGSGGWLDLVLTFPLF
jgi:hypothetical protein